MGAGFNYEKGLYDQLMEVMARLDCVDKAHKEETFQMNEEISALKKENRELYHKICDRHGSDSGDYRSTYLSGERWNLPDPRGISQRCDLRSRNPGSSSGFIQ